MKNRRWAGWRVLAAGWALCLIAATAATAAETWHCGENGEKWSPQSRLPDFSYAGYHCGEAPLPNLPRRVSVKDLGARGDGVADDSQAFLDALAKDAQGAIEVPAGRYKITKILEITRRRRRAAGGWSGQERALLPEHADRHQAQLGRHDHGPADLELFLVRRVRVAQRKPGTKDAGHGQGRSAAGRPGPAARLGRFAKPGQWILIAQRDPGDKTLVNYLYGGDPGDTQNLRNARAEMACRVTQVEGNTLHFDRPLRFDVRPAWADKGVRAERARERGGKSLF